MKYNILGWAVLSTLLPSRAEQANLGKEDDLDNGAPVYSSPLPAQPQIGAISQQQPPCLVGGGLPCPPVIIQQSPPPAAVQPIVQPIIQAAQSEQPPMVDTMPPPIVRVVSPKLPRTRHVIGEVLEQPTFAPQEGASARADITVISPPHYQMLPPMMPQAVPQFAIPQVIPQVAMPQVQAVPVIAQSQPCAQPPQQQPQFPPPAANFGEQQCPLGGCQPPVQQSVVVSDNVPTNIGDGLGLPGLGLGGFGGFPGFGGFGGWGGFSGWGGGWGGPWGGPWGGGWGRHGWGGWGRHGWGRHRGRW
jgi:hypothetical protein